MRKSWLRFFSLSILASTVMAVSAQTPALKIALILDKGGRDDRSFNQAAFEGATQAEKRWGVEVKTVEATDDNAFEPALRSFARKNFDLIIGVGFAQATAIQKVAKDFPKIRFAIVDADVKLPNVRSLMFEEQEGSYLMGAIAAMKSKTGKVGFVGGMDSAMIRRFEMGYKAGVQSINPKAVIVSNYVGVTGDAWNNPTKGKELALAQYKNGVDIIFAAAGATNMGVFDAAEEKKLLAIGTDSNQNGIKPGLILTSMLKRVDVAVLDTIRSLKEGKFKAESARFGIASEGVDFALDSNNQKLLDQTVISRVKEIKKQIISRKIDVPDYYRIGR